MKIVKKISIVAAILFAPIFIDSAFAQLPPTAGTTGPTNCFPPPCIPIDGGLSLLIAAGIGFASKKAYDHSKQVSAE